MYVEYLMTWIMVVIDNIDIIDINTALKHSTWSFIIEDKYSNIQTAHVAAAYMWTDRTIVYLHLYSIGSDNMLAQHGRINDVCLL